MATPPARSEISGSPNNATANAGFGKLWDYVTGLLGLTGSAADARSSLGISATNTPFSPASGLTSTNVQAALAEVAGLTVSGTPTVGNDSTSHATTAFVNIAIGGRLYRSVAGGASVTLVATEYGYGIIELYGALTGNINVIFPTAPTKSWIVKNSTSGAFTITAKTASGSGVLITQGKAQFIYSDGTNINTADNDILSAILAVDGAGSGLDSDLLDGQHGSYYCNASGSNAFGTGWGISITGSSGSCTGNAASASSVAWSGVTGKPTTIAGFGITDNNWSNLLSKPTTIAGFGLTDAVSKNGDTMAGALYNSAGSNYTTGGYSARHKLDAGSSTLFLKGGNTYSIGVGTTSNNSQWNIFRSTADDASAAATNLISVNIATGDITATGNVTGYSDIRLKTMVQPIENALNKVRSLYGITYIRKDTNASGTGLSAQDVLAVMPQAVTVDTEGILSVAYGNLVGLLVEAIKELDAELQLMRNKTGV